MVYVCEICGYEYDDREVPFSELPESWTCPVCGAPKSLFKPKQESGEKPEISGGETSSDLIVEALCDYGVKWVFGMVGHSNLGIADAIRKKSGRLGYIGIRHEGAAAFACSAYGKLTGLPAACLSIAGPGATNLITGLYDAKLDKSPVVALTGQIPSSELGQYKFQEIDLQNVFSDVTVHQQTIGPNTDFYAAGASACENAIIKRGVAQIILPDDVQRLSSKGEKRPSNPVRERKIPPSDSDIDAALSLIGKSSRPVIIAGNGAIDAREELLEFAELLGIPVATTYRAKGIIPDDHPLACGVIGLSGTPVAAHFVKSSDLMIAFGVGFSRHSTLEGSKPSIRVDNSEFGIRRFANPKVAILSDCSLALRELSKKSNLKSFDFKSEMLFQKNEWEEVKKRRASKNSDGKISIAAAISSLSEAAPDDAVISVDVGNCAYSMGRYFKSKKQRFLLSWYLGSIGVGLPSAIGAWCAEKDSGRRVVAFVGDGGFGQYLAEWTSVAKAGANIVCVVANNSELAKISLEQKNANMDVWETKLANPNFAEYSKSCGAFGIRVEKAEDLRGAFAAAFEQSGPALVEIMTDPSQV